MTGHRKTCSHTVIANSSPSACPCVAWLLVTCRFARTTSKLPSVEPHMETPHGSVVSPVMYALGGYQVLRESAPDRSEFIFPGVDLLPAKSFISSLFPFELFWPDSIVI
jgi:hypothetical protein